MKKRVFAIVLVLALVIASAIACSVVTAAEVVDSGTFGEGDTLSWTFDSDGVLTISGSGAMPAYSSNALDSIPWYAHRDAIVTVNVTGASNVGKCAFYAFPALKTVSLGSSVATVDDFAFYNCDSLVNLTFSEGLVNLKDRCFGDCGSLTEITIPVSFDSMNSWAFMYTKIDTVTFAEGVTQITTGGNWNEMSYLSTVNFPSTLTTIDSNVFYDCTNLNSVFIPKSVTRIGSSAFAAYSYNGVESIVFEDGGTEDLVILDGAFSGCEITELVLPERVTTIASGAFAGAKLETVHIPKNVSYISLTAFNPFGTSYDALKHITVADDNAIYSAKDGILYDKAGTTLVMCPRGRIGSVVVPAGVEVIGPLAFYYCRRVNSITLPEGLKRIEEYAMNDSDQNRYAASVKISRITIPASVEYIDPTALDNWNLTAITVAEGNQNYKSVDGILYTKDGKTLLQCPRKKGGEIVVPAGVEAIADKAFYGCRSVTALTLPDGLKTIGDSAFYECYKVETLVIPNTVESIGSGAIMGSFSYHLALTSVTLPEGVTLESGTFGNYYDSKLTQVTVVGETASVTLSGKDFELVTEDHNGTAPTVDAILSESQLENNLIVTETVGADTISYEVPAGSLKVENEDLVPTDGNVRVVFDNGTTNLEAVILPSGSKITEPAHPTRADLTFVGWYADAQHAQPWDFNTAVTSNTTLYAKWTFSVSIRSIHIDEVYDGNPVSLAVTNLTSASYQWYKNGVAVPAGISSTLTLSGAVSDSGTYYCVVSIGDVETTSEECSVVIRKASLSIHADPLIVPTEMVNDTLIYYLQNVGIPSDELDSYGVSLSYTNNGGVTDHVVRLINDGLLVLKLGSATVNDPVVTYPILLGFTDESDPYVVEMLDNYDITLSAEGTLKVMPKATLVWDSDVLTNGVSVDFRGEDQYKLAPNLFTATDGHANPLQGGTKGFRYYYTVTVVDIETSAVNSILKNQLDYALENDDTIYYDGDVYHFMSDSYVSYPAEALAAELTLIVEDALRDGDPSFVSLKHDYGVTICISYHVKATYSGNDTYYANESDEFVSFTVKPATVTVTAKDQSIFLGNSIKTDASALLLSGDILSDATIRDTLQNSLPTLLSWGALSISLSSDDYASAAGNYTDGIVVTYNESMVDPSVLPQIACFDIVLVPGDLSVVDPADVFDALEELERAIDAVESAQNADSATLAGLVSQLAAVRNDVSALQTADAALQQRLEARMDAADEAIRNSLNNLAGRVTALENQVSQALPKIDANMDTIADLVSDLAALRSDLTALSNTLSADYATKTELADAISDTSNTINRALSALEDRVVELEVGLVSANGRIDTNATEIGVLKTDVSALKNWRDNAQDALDDLADLVAAHGLNLTALQNALEALEDAVDNANGQILAAEARISVLEGKVFGLEAAKATLEAAVTDLRLKLAEKASVADLTSAINALSNAVDDAKRYADGLDSALRDELEDAYDLFDSAMDALKDRVSALETGLEDATDRIDLNESEITALKVGLSDLVDWSDAAQDAIDALEVLTTAHGVDLTDLRTALDDANVTISALEAKIALLDGRVSELERAKTALQNAVSTLQSAIATKADTATLNAKVSELNAAIADAEAVSKVYADAQDVALRDALMSAIGEAKTSAVSAAEILVNNVKTELQTVIGEKADAATVNAALDSLKAAIATLESVKDNYVMADTALKTDLEGKIEEAKTSAVSAAEILVNNAKTELQTVIDEKADTATVNAALDSLKAAIATLESVKDNYVTADTALKTDLEGKIEAAKTSAIDAAKTLVDNAKTELQRAIDAKADVSALNEQVKKLNEAIATAEKTAKAYVDQKASDLTDAIADAKAGAVKSAQDLVSKAKAELQAVIDKKADSATFSAAIKELQDAVAVLEQAKNDYVAADAALKAELEAAIEAAKKDAVEAAKGHIPYIGENGNWWIGDTDTGIKAAAVDGTNGKDGEDASIVIPTVIGGVALLGNFILLAYVIVLKRKIG